MLEEIHEVTGIEFAGFEFDESEGKLVLLMPRAWYAHSVARYEWNYEAMRQALIAALPRWQWLGWTLHGDVHVLSFSARETGEGEGD